MNSAQLESQSESKREGVEDTLRELRERLTPGEILDETLAYAKDGGGEFLSNLGRQIADNPLPVTLIGAGLALYLFSNGKGTSSAAAPSTVPGKPETSNSTAANIAGAASEMGSNLVDKVSSYSSRVGDQAGESYNAAANTLSDAASSVGNAAASASNAVAAAVQKTAEIAGSAKQTAADTTRNTVAFLKDQPLIMIGAGIALGAAIGAAIPATDFEDTLMGEASDAMKEQVSDVASEQLDEAKEAGKRLVDNMTEKAKDETDSFVSRLNDQTRSPSQDIASQANTVSGSDQTDQRRNGYSSSQ
jgi:hypothetical protein